MTDENVSATTVIDAPAEAVFAVLADPRTHAAVDGTGWVCESLDGKRLTAVGQTFRMAMYNANHPDGSYEVTQRVIAFDAPNAIAWEPATAPEDLVGGWRWRYDLTADGPSRTTVTHTYDWSAVPEQVRGFIQFPPFAPDHLSNSLAHLADLVISG